MQSLSGNEYKKNERILVFDILRIICIAVIIYGHSQFVVLSGINSILYANGHWPLNLYPLGLQGYAVAIMFLVSGAVLEYTYKNINNSQDYLRFIFKRFIRIYPAFWLSLLAAIILFPFLWQSAPLNALIQFSGFTIIVGQTALNPSGWFIGAIFCLYLLFPWISRIVRKYNLSAVIGFCILSWSLRFILSTYCIVPIDIFVRWFPLCTIFEFSVGIYLVQMSLYPKKRNDYPMIRLLADLSFYAFIFHYVIITFIKVYLFPSLFSFDTLLALDSYPGAVTLFYCQMMASVLIISWVMMKADVKFQKWLLERDAVRVFLKN